MMPHEHDQLPQGLLTMRSMGVDGARGGRGVLSIYFAFSMDIELKN